MTHRGHLLIFSCIAVVAGVACGGSSTPPAVTEAGNATLVGTLLPATTTSAVATTAVAVTPATSATTEPATTPPTTIPVTEPPTTEPTTTTVDPATELILSAVGLGPHAFGTAPGVVLDDFNQRFGVPANDDTTAFVSAAGSYISDDGCCSFVAPVGRTVCWPNGLCVTFGGSTSESLGLVGWQYQGDEVSSLHSAAGITLGSRWADFTSSMSVLPGGCYTVGSGTTSDGIDLVVEGGDFSVIADDGSETTLLPSPDQVTVIGMNAGEQIVDLASDC